MAQGASFRLARVTRNITGRRGARQMSIWTLYPNRLAKCQAASRSFLR